MNLNQGFADGYACLSAWADLLDQINVFPVADGDTGANLRLSLSPLRTLPTDRSRAADRLLSAATGNSGNIAAAFFHPLLAASSPEELPIRVVQGRDQARRAVAEPKCGTMLDIFDTLALHLPQTALTPQGSAQLLAALREAVLATTQALPALAAAGVVDAGALGMFVFFDGFFRSLTGTLAQIRPLGLLFPDRLALADGFQPAPNSAYCVDVLLDPHHGPGLTPAALARLGESVVVTNSPERCKIHIHTQDPDGLRTQLAQEGRVLGWTAEPLETPRRHHAFEDLPGGGPHLMTDAAGSLPRDLARQHGITLLDSYILSGEAAQPESLCPASALYGQMRQGHKVRTAQASLLERHRLYQSITEHHGPTLYLATGSAYTGNYQVARAWQAAQGEECPLVVLDTGSASGRLAVLALLTRRLARKTREIQALRAQARDLALACREYIFPESLRYLVASGRISRTRGFLGDLLGKKPVISPFPDGARRVGMVSDEAGQLDFALARVAAEITRPARALVLLQYTDNQEWVTGTVRPRLAALLPEAELLLAPLSLTSGVHLGPGTWSLAFGEEP